MRTAAKLFRGIACAALLASAQAHADATVAYVKGDVRSDGVPVAQGRLVPPGSTVTTGPGAQATLGFSDGQQIMLGADTALRIADFRYAVNEPRLDRATIDLQRGAMRLVSGALAARNPAVLAVRIPQATLSLRGTDFMVALASAAYVKVLKGSIGVTNLGGTVVFGADTAAVVASGSAIARPVFVSALPPAASGPFSSLAAAPAFVAAPPPAASGPSSSAAAAPIGAAPAQPIASRAAGAQSQAVSAPMIDGRTAVKIGVYAAIIGAALSGGSSTTQH